MALAGLGEVVRRSIPRLQFEGHEIRGPIVEVLLPKKNDKGEKEYSCAKTLSKQIKVNAKTVCFQVGDNNHVVFAGLAMPADVSDALTKVSEEDEMVIRVLRGYGTSEELSVNATKLSQAIEIYADFVRIVLPLDDKSEFTVDADTRLCVVNGNNHNILVPPEGLPNVFDSTRPVLRVLRMPTRPITVVRSAKDFPNIDKDQLIVLEIRENRFATTPLEYRFSESSSVVNTKRMRDFYDVKVSVSQCGKNGKTEIRDGVLFKREPSLDCFRGIVGFWCRFQTDKAKYIVTFSLWKTQTMSQTSEFLDEIPISFETTERKIPPRKLAKRKQSHLVKSSSGKDTSFPGRIHPEQTSLPERDHSSVTPSVETRLPVISHTSQEEQEESRTAEKATISECCLHIWKVLLSLRDDGEWEEFDRQAEHFLEEYAEDTDLQIVVALEQGMACCYRNELSSAEKFIKRAMKMISLASSTLIPLFKGRASYYLASIYRRDEMALGKAQRFIDSAKKHLADTAFAVDQVCLAYEEGSVLLEYAHKPCVVEQAKRCFDQCIELCSSEDTDHLIFRQHDLALMKKAMLLLDCSTTSGRESRTIDEGTLIEARQCLDRMKSNTVEEMPRISQVQYHVVRSDQYFREGRLIDAEAHARMAFDLSQNVRFDTERTAKVRFDCYNKLLNSNLHD